jgi:hypothetical protein
VGALPWRTTHLLRLPGERDCYDVIGDIGTIVKELECKTIIFDESDAENAKLLVGGRRAERAGGGGGGGGGADRAG